MLVVPLVYTFRMDEQADVVCSSFPMYYLAGRVCVMLAQESEAAIVSFAAATKRHRPVKSEHNEYIGLLQG